MAKGEPVRWITVKGRRVPVYEDGSMGGFMEGKKLASKEDKDGDYIISHNSEGQELRIPRKTYEDRLKRAKEYQENLRGMKGTMPEDHKKAQEQVEQLENALKTGKASASKTPEYDPSNVSKTFTGNVIKSKDSVADMMGFNRKDIVIQEGARSATDTTYYYYHKQLKQRVGSAVELRTSKKARINIYGRRKGGSKK